MELIQKLRTDLEKIDRITSKFLRDLMSLCYAPTLQHELIPSSLSFSFGTEENIELLLQWFEKNLHSSTPIQEKYLPLGKYAETLILFYLQHQERFQLLSHNLQLAEEKITRGELDFLFSEQGNEQTIHLELAVKFYLKVEQNGSEVYLGPSTKDWMKRKLKKLLSHQLELPHQNKDLLPAEFRQLKFRSQLYLKGSLFLPYEEWQLENHHPLNCGWWVPIDAIETVLNPQHHYNIITDKRDWLFPFNSRLKRYTKEGLLSLTSPLLLERNELMICRFDENKQIMDRGFVMRENWPLERL